MMSVGGEKMIQLNEQEKEVLKTIKNGENEFLFSREKSESKEGLPFILFNLKTFGFITAKDISTKDGVGYTDIQLTEKAKNEV